MQNFLIILIKNTWFLYVLSENPKNSVNVEKANKYTLKSKISTILVFFGNFLWEFFDPY